MKVFTLLLSLMRDEEGTTTVEWIVVVSVAVLIAAAAVKAVADKGQVEGTDIEDGINDVFGAMLP